MYVGNQTNVTVTASNPYIFTTKYITNNNINYNNTNGTFTIKEAGWYEIQFDTTAGATGEVNPVLYINGVASDYALGGATSTGATNFVNVAFSTVVHIVPINSNIYATIQIMNEGVVTSVLASNILIKRIG